MNSKYITILIIAVLGVGGFFIYTNLRPNPNQETGTISQDISDKESIPSESVGEEISSEKLTEDTTESVSEVVDIPFSLEKNCIGFLTSFPQEIPNISLIGAGWTRFHPGPFSWGKIENIQGDYDFSEADEYIEEAQKNNVAVLATIWPFADWDQTKCHSLGSCRGYGFEGEIPVYRCQPCDTTAYENFIKKLIERYDGDGVDDMPDLKIPVKYWEVLNEPEMQSSELTFFVGNESDYFEILKKSYNTIKQVCSDCKVLHGGNAGSQQEFLSFWDKVFSLGGGNYFDIANTHIIGQGDISTLNAKPFKNLLDKYNIKKPIWVTEAQYENSKADVGGSVSGALANGAEKIFFVSFQVGGLSRPVLGQFATEYQEAVQLCPF